MVDYTLDRIMNLTEHEAVYALCTYQITPDELYNAWGYHPRTTSVVEEYDKYKASCGNTDLYWDERIRRVMEQLEVLENNKRAGVLPPIPYGF